MKIAQLAIGAHDVENLMPLGQKVSGKSCAVRAGSLDTEGFDAPVSFEADVP